MRKHFLLLSHYPYPHLLPSLGAKPTATVNRLLKKLGTTYIGSMYDYKEQGIETAYGNAYTIATDMASFGFNLDFAPVADV